MIEKLKNSWKLVKASAGVLQKDRELLIFPIISSVGLLIVSAVFFVPLLFGNLLDALFGSESGIFGYIFLFFFYLVQYIVIFFANTALVGAAQIRLRGGDPMVSDGFRIATNHLGTIFGYAFIAATVGLILKIFSDKSKGVGRFVISLIGFAWNVATFLVVPILVTENVGPIEAIKRSAALLKKTWGEQIIGNFGLGAVFNLIYVLLFCIGIGLTATVGFATESVWAAVVMGVIFILIFALVSLVNSALSGILPPRSMNTLPMGGAAVSLMNPWSETHLRVQRSKTSCLFAGEQELPGVNAIMQPRSPIKNRIISIVLFHGERERAKSVTFISFVHCYNHNIQAR